MSEDNETDVVILKNFRIWTSPELQERLDKDDKIQFNPPDSFALNKLESE